MGLFKSLSRLKLKKIQPGKILVAVAKKIGGPIGGIASAAEKTVAAFNKTSANVKQTAKDLGLTPEESAARIAEQVATGAQAAAAATDPTLQAALKKASDNKQTLIMVGAGVLVLFLIMRERRA